MASATYDCPKCGKSIRVSRGNSRDSERYAKWCAEQGRVCSECHQAEFRAAHEARIAAAATDPTTASLPPLTGTEKQIAWAQALRLEALAELDSAVAQMVSGIEAEDELSVVARQEMVDAIHLVAQEYRARTDAHAWIDTRGVPVGNVLRRELNSRRDALCPTVEAELAALFPKG